MRDDVHVVDLAAAHVLALRALAAARPGGVYDLGSGGRGYGVREVVAAVRRVTGREVPVREAPRRAGDPPVLVASSAPDGGTRPERPTPRVRDRALHAVPQGRLRTDRGSAAGACSWYPVQGTRRQAPRGRETW